MRRWKERNPNLPVPRESDLGYFDEAGFAAAIDDAYFYQMTVNNLWDVSYDSQP